MISGVSTLMFLYTSNQTFFTGFWILQKKLVDLPIQNRHFFLSRIVEKHKKSFYISLIPEIDKMYIFGNPEIYNSAKKMIKRSASNMLPGIPVAQLGTSKFKLCFYTSLSTGTKINYAARNI